MRNKNIKLLAHALKDGGVSSYFNFPGYYSHALFDELGGTQTSTNEKIAYETAWGSAQAGIRTVVTFKNVGLNDAADPFLNSMLTGVRSGLVMVVFDDMGVEGSQCRLDSRHFWNFFGGLWLEPYSRHSLELFARVAPELSELFDIPIVLRITQNTLDLSQYKIREDLTEKEIISIAREVSGLVQHSSPKTHPYNAASQEQQLEIKNGAIQKFSDELHKVINKNRSAFDSLTMGMNDDEAYRIVALPVPILPKSKLSKIKNVKEYGDSIIWDQLVTKLPQPVLQSRIRVNPLNRSNYITYSGSEELFGLLKERFDFICADLGEYTWDTLDTAQYCLSFGSSPAIAMGALLANKKAVSICGDGSFYHSGKNVIDEANIRNIALKIVLIDNGGSKGSGGQKIPGTMPASAKVITVESGASGARLKELVKAFIASNKVTILKINQVPTI